VSIGTGTVSEDGARIESDPGVGILKAGWHGNWLTRAGARAAGCPEIDSCRDAFFSFDSETFGCQVGGDAPNGKACAPEPKGAKIEVKVGGATVTELPEGDSWDPDEPGELIVVGEDAGIDAGLSAEDYCGAQNALATNVVVGDSCLGTCRSGTCEPGLFGDSQVKKATCLMIDRFYECIPAGDLKDRLTDHLEQHGLRVSCRPQGGKCSPRLGGYASVHTIFEFEGPFSPITTSPSNAITLCENALEMPESVLFHELIHSTSRQRHGFICSACVFTPFEGCCGNDLAYGCTRRCFEPSEIWGSDKIAGVADACQ
jgi:hypothetical protein